MMAGRLRHVFVLLAHSLLGACAMVPAAVPVAAPHSYARGVVSAADPRAAEAGAAMLRQGGSATDAAIATMLALTVVEPQSSGIGGGGFLVEAAADGTVETWDGRETAPAAATPEWFIGSDGKPVPFPQAVKSGLSIGVPGNLRLAAEAHQRHGKLGWAALFRPAITLAEKGFAVTPRLHDSLASAQDRAALSPAGAALFYDAAGQPLPTGTVIRNRDLAHTLRRIAKEGPDSFYTGDMADGLAQIVAGYTPVANHMVAADLATYQAKPRNALCGQYRQYRICGMGPPSSGATTVYAILKQLERFDLHALGPQSVTSWHLFAESQRLAYADRDAYLGDTDFVSVPVAGLMAGDYLAARGTQIDPARRMATVQPGIPVGIAQAGPQGLGPVEQGTTHFAIVDREGAVASYTSTVEGPFGSGLMIGGFFLNNELTDFSFVPARDGRPVANRVQGGKRPRSSMAPTVVFGPDGKAVLVIGAAGGATIPVQVAKALIGVLDFGLSAQEAIALPGLFDPDGTIMLEPNSPLLVMKPQLEALGHAVVVRPMPFKANAVQHTPGGWTGAADPRSEGAAVSE
ncbi:MAG: Gamma-glutamyltranspeptidase precursor [Pseudomonadota bacterium]|jgi:gamma-glutamyltranspeptidase/glutathione hydrolase